MKVLIVDADPGTVEAVGVGLALRWPEVELISAGDGQQGLARFIRESPDLTLLDVNLPRSSGWDMLERIRALSNAPVIIVTACGGELARVKGLELGADDYVTKPFSHLELSARIQTILRRTRALPRHGFGARFVGGDLQINFARQEVTVGGGPVVLTPTEYRLLALLARNAGRVMPAASLLAQVWGSRRGATDDLKRYISRLRRKLGEDARAPRYIFTQHGFGYRLARSTEPQHPPAACGSPGSG